MMFSRWYWKFKTMYAEFFKILLNIEEYQNKRMFALDITYGTKL